MNELSKKINQSIERLKMFEPETEPYFLCYSGGKDSDVIRILASLANVKHEIHHNLTTVDAPETIAYIKSIPNVNIDIARYEDGTPKTMWNLIVKKKMPPTRLIRYCCKELKEQGGKGRLKITGVRWTESVNRAKNQGGISIIGKPKRTEKFLEENNIEYQSTPKGGLVLNLDNDENRRAVEHCYRTTSTIINPIIDWTESDVWEFLNYYNCKSNPLYYNGRCRVGCIGCPMAGYKGQLNEFKKYPKYFWNYVRAFDRMIKAYETPPTWRDGFDVMRWWIKDDLSYFLK